VPASSHPRPWRRGSLFGPGPRRPLDRNERARFRYLLDAHRRAGRLSPSGQIVGTALLRRVGENGQCDPAQATLAADAGCCLRTVKRALAVMRRLGLVCWQMRLVRVGWRAEQSSNAYVLTPGAVRPACECHFGLETDSVSTERGPTRIEPLPAEVLEARAALAVIAERRRLALVGR
jgi:helix-turn-helix protein